jgi:glycosyltransferase involved in cell wall biosynthesis
MNILFFTSNETATDGWSVVGYNIKKNLANWNIEVFSGSEKNKLFFGKKRLKSEYCDMFANKWQLFKYFVFIYDMLCVLIKIDDKPDIIHCNVEYYAPVCMYLSKLYKVPYTITAYGTYGVTLPVKYKVYKRAFENAEKVITISYYTKRRMEEEKINCNYKVIFLGVDKEIFKYDANIQKENTITFVGNLKKRKGLVFLLEAIANNPKVSSIVKLVVIGYIDKDTTSFADISKYIEKNNLNVVFVGKVSIAKLVQYYQRAKINILPSRSDPFYFEGFGLVHVEANACGTYTIGTTNSGNEDAIIKENGYLVKYGDVEDLSKIIYKLLFANEVYKINTSAILDWQDVTKQYSKIFQCCITNRKSLVR